MIGIYQGVKNTGRLTYTVTNTDRLEDLLESGRYLF